MEDSDRTRGIAVLHLQGSKRFIARGDGPIPATTREAGDALTLLERHCYVERRITLFYRIAELAAELVEKPYLLAGYPADGDACRLIDSVNDLCAAVVSDYTATTHETAHGICHMPSFLWNEEFADLRERYLRAVDLVAHQSQRFKRAVGM